MTKLETGFPKIVDGRFLVVAILKSGGRELNGQTYSEFPLITNA